MRRIKKSDEFASLKTVGIFGVLETTGTETKFTETVGGGATPIADYVFRQSGITKEMVRSDKLAMALGKPEVYFEQKKIDLYNVGIKLDTAFRADFDEYVQMGYTQEKSRDKATKRMETYKAELMKIHDANFPTEMNRQATEKLLKINK